MDINPFDILKNAQKLQAQMGVVTEKLRTMRITGSAGGGMVEIDFNGCMEVLDVRISPETMSDRDMLQDLVKAALTSAAGKLREILGRQMGGMMGLNPVGGQV
jgi:DNA-binding YbaB/EbfC family protein